VSKKTAPKARTRRRTAPKSATPALIHRLIDSFLLCDRARVDQAFRHAQLIVAKERLEPNEDVCLFTERAGDAFIRRHAPEVFAAPEWGRHSGTIHEAIGEPNFVLGFSVAYLLFTDKGGAR